MNRARLGHVGERSPGQARRCPRTISARDAAARLAFLACLAIIALLSIVPGQLRPHTGLHGRLEHTMAYAVAGFFLGLAYSGRNKRLLAFMGVAALSFLLELFQLYVPERSSNVLDAFASDAGLFAGLMVTMVGELLFARKAVSGGLRKIDK